MQKINTIPHVFQRERHVEGNECLVKAYAESVAQDQRIASLFAISIADGLAHEDNHPPEQEKKA